MATSKENGRSVADVLRRRTYSILSIAKRHPRLFAAMHPVAAA